jgi:hypothetical protein
MESGLMIFDRDDTISKPAKTAAVSCIRCDGTGIFCNGTCFRCGGRQVDPTGRGWTFPSSWSDEQCRAWHDARETRNAAAREKARRARLSANTAKKAAEAAAKAVACPARIHMTDLASAGDSKAHDTLASIMAGEHLSDAQQALCLRLTQDILDREIHGAPEMTLGRQVIEARVVKHGSKLTQFGCREVVTLKTSEGAILWGTCPQSLFRTETGQSVKLTATIEAGWAPGCYKFSRPSKATTA